jgi:hypothetical protein
LRTHTSRARATRAPPSSFDCAEAADTIGSTQASFSAAPMATTWRKLRSSCQRASVGADVRDLERALVAHSMDAGSSAASTWLPMAAQTVSLAITMMLVAEPSAVLGRPHPETPVARAAARTNKRADFIAP